MQYLQGPTGHTGGGARSAVTIPDGAVIIAFAVEYAKYVLRITLFYKDAQGQESMLTFGGADGGPGTSGVISLNAPITQIGGTYGSFVNTISFRLANGEEFGPYGTDPTSVPFTYEIPKGAALVGFWGRTGSYIDALGPVYGAPV